jgi:phage gp29-like protein
MVTTLPAVNFYNPASDLYTRAISSTYKYGIRLYDPDFGLARDPDLQEKLMKDPEIYSSMRVRLNRIAGADWAVIPASDDPVDKTLAAVVDDAFRHIQRFSQARFELAKAVFWARAYQFVNCQDIFTSLAGLPAQMWSLPITMKDIDKKRFDFVPVNEANRDPRSAAQDRFKVDQTSPGGVQDAGTDIQIYERLWSVTRGQWEKVVRPEFFIRCVWDDEEARLGYGRGLSEALFFFWRFKTIALEQGMAGLEKWAQGLTIAKIDDTRLGSTDKSNEEIRDAYMEILKHMRSQHILAIGSKDDIQVVEPTGTGHELVLNMLRYFDEAMTKVILGSIRPTGGGLGGSLARTEEEAETTNSIIQYDRSLLDDVLTRDLIGLFMLRNKLQLESIGLGNAHRPSFRTSAEKRKDPKAAAEVIKIALEAGIRLKSEEVYDKLEFTQPVEGDDVIEKAAPQPFSGNLPGEGGSENSTQGNQQLKEGEKVEKEHTKSPEIAKSIAEDHVKEDPNYYTKLKQAGL